MGPLFEKRFDPGPTSGLNSVLNDDSGSVLGPGSNCTPDAESTPPRVGAAWNCWLAISCETFLVAFDHFAWRKKHGPSAACTKHSAHSHSQSAFARGPNGGGGEDVLAVLGG